MTAAGWFIMVVSISAVLALVGFCLWKVLSLPPVEVESGLHGQPAIDTGDTEDAD